MKKWTPQGIEAAGATACLPGLDMKFVQQRAVAGRVDQIFTALEAALPFNGRAFGAANPPAFQAAVNVEAPGVEARAAATGRRECTGGVQRRALPLSALGGLVELRARRRLGRKERPHL